MAHKHKQERCVVCYLESCFLGEPLLVSGGASRRLQLYKAVTARCLCCCHAPIPATLLVVTRLTRLSNQYDTCITINPSIFANYK